MTYQELNQYILHYLKEDKTHSAIMLTGEWGTGKSHYIQNELVPYIQKNNSNCITVSLYGLESTAEISKSIYLELRTDKFSLEGEGAAAGKLIAKTVLKGITSFFGIDVGVSDSDMQVLYESIDLSRKLIVLEDIERSRINILELLGYVNNLVEQDGVKILLVANEFEIIKYTYVKDDTQLSSGQYHSQKQKSIVRKPTDETVNYLTVKEKTISDTIYFESDYRRAIVQIIKSFDSSRLNKFSDDDAVGEIYSIMMICRHNNLRSFIFACQKVYDIFEQMVGTYDDDFLKSIFYGILFYSFRIKSGQTLRWDTGEYYSIELGDERYPLFKFCYDYITQQSFSIAQIPAAAEAFKKKQLYDKRKTINDPDLQVLFNYYVHYEQEVQTAVNSISERLKNIGDISFYDYGAIGIYSITVKHLLGIDIGDIADRLVENLNGQGGKLQLEELFRTTMSKENATMFEEYNSLR